MKYINIFFLIGILSPSFCYGQQVHGFIMQTIVTPDSVQRSNLNYVSDEQTYVTGGVTFTYPVGLFSVAPFVNISIQPTTPHGNTQTFTAEISANSASSATVKVYHLVTNAGLVEISEAATGSVIIHFFAIGD